MTTTTKIGFDESSKAVTATVHVTSDELEPQEVLDLAEKYFIKATEISNKMSLRKNI